MLASRFSVISNPTSSARRCFLEGEISLTRQGAHFDAERGDHREGFAAYTVELDVTEEGLLFQGQALKIQEMQLSERVGQIVPLPILPGDHVCFRYVLAVIDADNNLASRTPSLREPEGPLLEAPAGVVIPNACRFLVIGPCVFLVSSL